MVEPSLQPADSFSILPATTEAAGGLVFASAHSGRLYPADMAASADIAALRTAEDAMMDHMIASAPSQGVSTLLGLVGRAYVDLNRSVTDLDPALIQDCEDIQTTGKTIAGYGVLHRLSGNGMALYNRRIPRTEAEQRLSHVHIPYHQALSNLMAEARKRNGTALLVDWHSMPARATGPTGPDIILGDRFGSSCDAVWTRALRAAFESRGLKVGLNRPYAGGYATQLWGQPENGYQALQVEVNRRLYWDEQNHVPNAGWKRCQTLMKQVISDLCVQARQSTPTD